MPEIGHRIDCSSRVAAISGVKKLSNKGLGEVENEKSQIYEAPKEREGGKPDVRHHKTLKGIRWSHLCHVLMRNSSSLVRDANGDLRRAICHRDDNRRQSGRLVLYNDPEKILS